MFLDKILSVLGIFNGFSLFLRTPTSITGVQKDGDFKRETNKPRTRGRARRRAHLRRNAGGSIPACLFCAWKQT